MTAAGVETRSRDSRRDLTSWLIRSADRLWEREQRARLGRLLLYVLVFLLPLHAGLVAVHVPSAWKELLLGVILVIALTLPTTARFDRVDYLVLGYFALVVLSAGLHRVTNLSDLAPYFVYVPFAVVAPRLELSNDHLRTLVRVAIASLLFNVVWMVGLRIGWLRILDLSSVDGGQWAATGSLTGGGLDTAMLYGIAAGTAWIGAAVSGHKISLGMLAGIFTAAANMTGSRAGLIVSGAGVLLALIVWGVRYRSQARTGRIPRIASVVGVLGLVPAWAAAATIGVVTNTSIYQTAGTAGSARAAAPAVVRSDDLLRMSRWTATIALAVQNPLLGAGPGATSQSRAVRDLGLNPSGELSDTLIGTRVSESSLLKVAAEVGFPALIAMALWIWTVLVRAGTFRIEMFFDQPIRLVGPALVALTLLNGVTFQNMESFIGASLFWLGVGLCRTDQGSNQSTWSAFTMTGKPRPVASSSV